ncbi:AIR synthase related, N-terminal domain protein, partial [Vibrio parahaemolyticus V-223/04]
TTMKMRTS